MFYEEDMNIKREENGNILIEMTPETFNFMVNSIYTASDYYAEQGLEATAAEIKAMWRTMTEKEDELHHENI